MAQGEVQPEQAIPFQYGVKGLEQVRHWYAFMAQVEQLESQGSQVRLTGFKNLPGAQEVHLVALSMQVRQFESHAAQTVPVQ